MVIGAGKRAEIWNPAVFDEATQQLTPEFMEEEFMKLGF